jgi:hypothetical protein
MAGQTRGQDDEHWLSSQEQTPIFNMPKVGN